MGHNLLKLRKEKGWTQDEAADALGMSRGGYIKIERGERPINRKHIQQAMKAYGVPISAIIMDAEEAEMFNALMRQEPPAAEFPEPNVNFAEIEDVRRLPRSGPRNVPVYGTALGGRDDEGDFRFEQGGAIDFAPRPPGIADRKDVYALYTRNDSMYPRYDDGDRLYVDPHRSPRVRDDVVLEVRGKNDDESGRGYIKRLVKKTPSKIIVEQFNPPKQIEFDIDDVIRIHRVIPTEELFGT